LINDVDRGDGLERSPPPSWNKTIDPGFTACATARDDRVGAGRV
jgi:hypothetical protein